jgi:hypothetical protein
MLNAITPTTTNVQNTAPQPDEKTLVRNKRSLEQPSVNGPAIDFSGPSASDRPRNSGGLDSLGGGRLL